MNSTVHIALLGAYLAATVIAKEQALEPASSFAEEIYYFDPDRPPVIEVYIWDKDKYWKLDWVYFDSDGDWALDTSMFFVGKAEKRSAKELEAQRKLDEQFHRVRKDGVLFTPHFEKVKNTIRLYRQSDLYQALEKDKKFRLALDTHLRLLSPPRPIWSGNLRLRELPEYQALLKRLATMKVNPPPEVPKDKTER